MNHIPNMATFLIQWKVHLCPTYKWKILCIEGQCCARGTVTMTEDTSPLYFFTVPQVTKLTRVIPVEPSVTKVTRVIEGQPSVTKVTRVIESQPSVSKVTRVIETQPSVSKVTRVISGEYICPQINSFHCHLRFIGPSVFCCLQVLSTQSAVAQPTSPSKVSEREEHHQNYFKQYSLNSICFNWEMVFHIWLTFN